MQNGILLAESEEWSNLMEEVFGDDINDR
jgi:hypothetical protein